MVGGAETPDRQGHTHAPRLRTGRAISAAAVPPRSTSHPHPRLLSPGRQCREKEPSRDLPVRAGGGSVRKRGAGAKCPL